MAIEKEKVKYGIRRLMYHWDILKRVSYINKECGNKLMIDTSKHEHMKIFDSY